MLLDLDYINSKLPPEVGPIQIDNIVDLEFRVKNDDKCQIEENDISIFYSWNNPKMEQRGQTYIVRVKDGEPKECYITDFKGLHRIWTDNILKNKFFSENDNEVRNYLKKLPHKDGFIVNDCMYKHNYDSKNILTGKFEDLYYYPMYYKNDARVLDRKWYNEGIVNCSILRYGANTLDLNKIYLLERYSSTNKGNLEKFPKLAELSPSLVFYYFDSTDNFEYPKEFLIELSKKEDFNRMVKKFFGVDSLPLRDFTFAGNTRISVNEHMILTKSMSKGKLFTQEFDEKSYNNLKEIVPNNFSRLGFIDNTC